ncbi:MAG: C4-type zinc ribbon domain-containing protein [Oligoflexia bacterium]|nr:C4-type zinc ribbon domain-containing protein [Oligoflexia bacterium]
MTSQIPLAEQIKALEHLQELDLKIDQLKKTKNGLPVALKALEDGLAKVRLAVQLKNNAIEEIEKSQRQTRAALDLNRDRLTRSTSRLEIVKNSQEFQAINKEIDQIKKLNGTLEEQNKKADLEIEAIRKEMAGLNTQLEASQTERDAQAERASSEGGKLESEIQGLLADRVQYSSKVEKRTLALYDRVRVARGGLGLVPAHDGRCKGCNMMVPPQLFNEIRKISAIHSCPSCHRLLFVPGQPAAQAAPTP